MDELLHVQRGVGSSAHTHADERAQAQVGKLFQQMGLEVEFISP